MSTKTSIKRIALVAVSALGFGLLSVVPSSAAASNVSSGFISRETTVDVDGAATGYSATALTSATTLATNAPGVSRTTGLATDDVATAYNFTALTVPAGTAIVFRIRSSNSNVEFTTDDTHTLTVGGQVITSATGTASAVNTLSWTVPSTAAAGTYTASIKSTTATPFENVFTLTITAKSAGVAALSADYSSMKVVKYADRAQCTASASATFATTMATYAVSTGYAYGGDAADATTATNYIVCINTRNGLDNAVTPGAIYISTGKGFLSDSANASEGTTPGISATPGAGMTKLDLVGDSIQEGATTITATITYGTSAITLTAPFTWYGDLASLTIGNYGYASATSANNTADALYVVAKDEAGNVIPYAAWTETAATGLVTTSITDASAADLKVVSSMGNGATVAARGQSNAYATVVTAGAHAGTGLTSYGSIDVDCAASRPESLEITIYGYNVNTLAQDIASNTVTYVCSSSTPATVTVTPASAEVVAGGTTTVDVLVKDANGLIVPDGTSVSLATANGNAIVGGSTSTTNGGLYTKATFVASSDSNTASVTGVAGSATGRAEIKVGTGVSNASASADAAADAAAEAIDAANAATDAANLAAEAADAATVAAEEARDAADAATAAVEELATQVATLMAALKAQITTLANTVAKIAKKVKA